MQALTLWEKIGGPFRRVDVQPHEVAYLEGKRARHCAEMSMWEAGQGRAGHESTLFETMR